MLFKSVIVSLLWFFSQQALATTLVEFKTTEGDFVIELYPEKAPKTVENFLTYVKEGFYENTIFHRVISKFMVQGGGFERNLIEKETRAPVLNESNNGLLNNTATIAMARTQDPNSATSQFYINLVDNQFLNYTSPEPDRIGYCVFGKVVKGMDVIHNIGIKPTNNQRGFSDVPIRPIVIQKATVLNSVN